MIVVDTSAIFAVLYKQAEAKRCAAALGDHDPLLISAGTMAEARVVAARSGFSADLERLVSQLKMTIIPVTADTAEAVGHAYARWGKGPHPAGLNFGDCFAYALAQDRGCPLLFIGEDFAKTDVAAALG